MWLKSENLRKWVFAYLALPNLIFMIGYLRWEISLPAVVALLAALISIWRGGSRRDVVLEPLVPSADCVHLPMPWAVVFVVAVVLWCIMAGQGGFVVQTGDWNWRNATFRDLITHEWPVRYDDFNRALVFYVGHWLPAAVVGKVVLGVTGDVSIAWRVGNVALLVWTASGLLIALAQLSLLLKAETPLRRFGVLALLIFFGGMDLFGSGVLNVKRIIIGGGAESVPWWRAGDFWAAPFNFTSNSTCLYWVFHQTVATWVTIYYIAKGVCLSELALIVALVLICAPLPSIGIAFMVFVLLLHQLLFRRMKLTRLIKEMLSTPNVVGAIAVVFVVFGYLSANDNAGNLTFVWEEMGAGFFARRWPVFISCEIGLYLLLTFKWFRGNPWWWAMLIWLCFCSTVRISHKPDFCMRAMMPAFVSLSVMATFSFIRYRCRRDWRAFALAGCLAVGAYVPVTEILEYAYRTVHVGIGVVVEDRIGTFDQDLVGRHGEDLGNFIVSMCNVSDPDSRFFYRWMARKHSRKEKGK